MKEHLKELIGTRVEHVHLSDDRELVLHFCNTEVVSLRAPWAFTSCLMSLSAADFEGEADGLIGLVGAQLTAVESDGARVDLELGSIKISSSRR